MKFERTVQIHPSHLGPDFLQKIHEIVENKYVGSCSESNGYIVDVGTIRIISARTEYTSPEVSVTVCFNATTVKPACSDVYTARSVKTLANGTMFDYMCPVRKTQCLFKIFVPNESIKEGSSATIEITATKYMKHQYNCIGKLVN